MEDSNYSESEDDVKQLVIKYENMLHSGVSEYFDSDDLIAIAEYYARLEKPDKSMEVLNYAIQLHPDDLDVQIYRCQAMIVQGRTLEAEILLDSLPDQKDREVIFLRAGLLLDKMDFRQVNDILSNLAKEENYSRDSLLDIAYFYLDAGLPKQARKWVELFVKEYPGDDEVRELMFQYAYDSKEYDRATEVINKDLDENPYETDDWFNLARCYVATDQTEKAIEALEFALTIDDTQTDILKLCALCYMKTKQFQKAAELEKKVIGINPKDTNAFENLVLCTMAMKEYGQAIHYLDRVLDECSDGMPSNEKASFYLQRADANMKMKEFEKCKDDLETALKYDSGNPMIYLTSANYFLEIGEHENAAVEASYAELYAGDNEEALKGLIFFYLECNLSGDALKIAKRLEKALDNETIKRYYYLIAYCLWVSGNKSDELTKYIVNAIVYMPEVLNNEKQLDDKFSETVKSVWQMMLEEKISPEKYLNL